MATLGEKTRELYYARKHEFCLKCQMAKPMGIERACVPIMSFGTVCDACVMKDGKPTQFKAKRGRPKQ